MKRLLLFTISVIGFTFTQTLLAQYTLTINDVQVANGSIVKCTYNFSQTNIVIPDSLDGQKIIEIGSYAFQQRDAKPQITAISLPEGLEKIGNFAFAYNAITSLTIPTTVLSIGMNAFESNKLTTLSIPANVQVISDNAFHDNDIASLTLNEGLIKIGDYSFNNNEITSLVIPNSVTDLGTCAFQINKISNLTIGSGIQYIGHRTFWENKLTTLVIPEGVTTICEGAFSSNQITNLTIPSTVTQLYDGPFNDNAITMVNGEPSKGIIYGRNSDGSVRTDIIESYGGTSDIIDFIPENVSFIGGNAFYQSGITSVTLPNNVTGLYHFAFADNDITSVSLPEGLKHIGYSAFFNNKITSIDIPTTVNFIGGAAFNMNTITTLNGEPTNGLFYARYGDGTERPTKIVSYAGSDKSIDASLFTTEIDTIGGSAFESSELTSAILPNTVSVIEANAFQNNLLTNITLSEGLKTIETNAFNNNRLSIVNIPNSITFIGDGAFQNNLLTSVTLPTTLTELQAWVFNNNKLTNISIPSTVTFIGDGAFAGNNLSSLSISSAITEIGASAFSSNNLTSLNIPGNVEKIGNSCFTENNLTSLTLNNGLKIIGDGVFTYNQLTQSDVSIPHSVSSIGAEAFSYNTSIDSLYLHQPTVSGFKKWVDGYGLDQAIDTWVKDLSTSYIADVELTLSDADIEIVDGYIQSANYDIRANKITIPRILKDQVVIGIRNSYHDHVNNIYIGGVFEYKSIISIKLPTSLQHIGDNAFRTNKLTEIAIPDSARYIGTSAFYDNPELVSLTLPNPADPDFIEWNDENYNIFAGGTVIYNFGKKYIAQYKYTLTDDDVEMQDGAIISCSYNFKDKNIIIPEVLDGQNVISIREIWMDNDEGHMEAFGIFQNQELISIQLPATLDTIKFSSFAWNMLKSVSLPEGLRYIDHNAFEGNQLKEIIITDSVSFIGSSAFSHNLFSKIVLPKPNLANFVGWYDHEYIKYNGGDIIDNFSKNYHSLYKHTLTDNDVEMQNGAIISCSYDFSAKYLIIPETLDGQKVQTIKEIWKENEHGPYFYEGMFQWKDLIAVDLPLSLDSIGQDAFNGNRLSFINIPQGVKHIGHGAFRSNYLDSIILPDSIPSNRAVFTQNKIKKVNGKPSDGIFYKVTDAGIIDSTTIACYGSNHEVIDFLDEQVLHIATDAFSWCEFTQVSLTTQLQTIGDFAFSGNRLNNLEIPNSVTYIGDGAFQEGSLREFTIPTPQTDDFLYWYDNQNPVEQYAGGTVITDLWKRFTALIKYTLTDDDVVMKNGIMTNTTFDFPSEYEYVVIPDTLDNQPVISLPQVLKENEGGAYWGGLFQNENRHLVGVELPATLDTIGENTFGGNRLDSIILPEGLKYINNNAFNGNPLTTVSIPNSVNYIGYGAFAGCNISEITLPTPQTNDFFYWFDNYDPVGRYEAGTKVSEFEKSYTALIKYTLTDDDVVMENSAMVSRRHNLKSRYLIIPDTLDGQVVKNIKQWELTNEEGPYTFGMFQGVDDNVLFGVELPTTLDSISDRTFSENKIDSILLPQGLTYIGNNAFENAGLDTIIIPDSVTYIGHNAFGSNNFMEMVLPNPISDDFLYWNDQENAIYEGGTTISNLWDSFTAMYKYTLTDDDVVVENGAIIENLYDYRSNYIIIPEVLDGQEVISIREIRRENDDGTYIDGMFQSFDGNMLIGVDLPETLDSIGINAFGWNQLKKINLPVGLRFINDAAFQGNHLPSVSIPDSVTYIGSAAFAENPLGEITFPNPNNDDFVYWYDQDFNKYDGGSSTEELWNNYTALYKYTLTDDDVMVENGAIVSSSYDFHSPYIVIPEELDGQNVVKIAENEGSDTQGIFQSTDDRQLLGIDLPSTLEHIGKSAFNSNRITEVILPDNLKNIDDRAFQYNELTSISLPGTIKYVGDAAFADNTGEFDGFTLPAAPDGMIWTDTEGNYYEDDLYVGNFYTAYYLTENVGVKNNNESQLFIYPNPAKDDLFIDNNTLLNAEINIYNATGKLLYSNNITSNIIDISNLELGLYFIKIISKNQETIQKATFIKQ